LADIDKSGNAICHLSSHFHIFNPTLVNSLDLTSQLAQAHVLIQRAPFLVKLATDDK
jgi:hypothetical protein